MKIHLRTMDEKQQVFDLDIFPSLKLILDFSNSIKTDVEFILQDEGRKPVVITNSKLIRDFLKDMGQKCPIVKESAEVDNE